MTTFEKLHCGTGVGWGGAGNVYRILLLTDPRGDIPYDTHGASCRSQSPAVIPSLEKKGNECRMAAGLTLPCLVKYSVGGSPNEGAE